jgi:peptidoglycan-associated lipoprotein
MKRIKACALLALTFSILSGCSSAPLATPSAQVPASAAGSAPSMPAAAGSAKAVAPSSAVTTALPHLDPGSAISRERSVYFDFDDFSIKSQYTALIERHGKYLISQPTLAIKIEGNADERGSSEYNLALGQKRAQAVLRALKLYGVNDAQMEAVSWGKERPKASGHDEAALAQNRRADLVYPRR